MRTSARRAAAAAAILLVTTACARRQNVEPAEPGTAAAYDLAGPLIPATTTMTTAWEVPRNPLTDAALDVSPLGDQIRRGYRLFINTPAEAPAFVHNRLSCGNCHLNAGQRARALPVVGIAAAFPEYNKRDARSITLGERVISCFMRSENGSAGSAAPTTTSSEVLALSAYITWLSQGYATSTSPSWRGRNAIAAAKLIPIDRLDPRRGAALFDEHCSSCHGQDGQGVQIGDKRAGPLWGPDSWNDGAGAARVYTLAGIIRYEMPYLDPGSLSDEQAQEIAAFITSKPRPAYAGKANDYPTVGPPIDAVYYRR